MQWVCNLKLSKRSKGVIIKYKEYSNQFAEKEAFKVKIDRIGRKIIYQGTSLDEFNKIQDRLEGKNIEYRTKINESKGKSTISAGQEIGAPASEGIDVSKIYVIYIHEDDLENAREALMEKE